MSGRKSLFWKEHALLISGGLGSSRSYLRRGVPTSFFSRSGHDPECINEQCSSHQDGDQPHHVDRPCVIQQTQEDHQNVGNTKGMCGGCSPGTTSQSDALCQLRPGFATAGRLKMQIPAYTRILRRHGPSNGTHVSRRIFTPTFRMIEES